MTKYTRRMKHKGGAGAAAAAPEAAAAFAVVDGDSCGHIRDRDQNQVLMNTPLIQQAVNTLRTHFEERGYMTGRCFDLLSHIVCPLVWRVLHAAATPGIDPRWLNYGLPAGSGLRIFSPAQGCTIGAGTIQRLYDNDKWDSVVAVLIETPGFVEWLRDFVTGGVRAPGGFPANARLASGVSEDEFAMIQAALGGEEEEGWENEEVARHLSSLSPQNRAAIEAARRGGKRSTRRKQRKNKRKTRR